MINYRKFVYIYTGTKDIYLNVETLSDFQEDKINFIGILDYE